MLAFHLFNQATLGISFLPHVLCIAAFLPLEGLGAPVVKLRTRRPTPPAVPTRSAA
jgi:hypothetical protein